jgi:hypothetical protein
MTKLDKEYIENYGKIIKGREAKYKAFHKG